MTEALEAARRHELAARDAAILARGGAGRDEFGALAAFAAGTAMSDLE